MAENERSQIGSIKNWVSLAVMGVSLMVTFGTMIAGYSTLKADFQHVSRDVEKNEEHIGELRARDRELRKTVGELTRILAVIQNNLRVQTERAEELREGQEKMLDILMKRKE